MAKKKSNGDAYAPDPTSRPSPFASNCYRQPLTSPCLRLSVLSIDIGSTSTRICVLTSSGKRIVIEGPQSDDLSRFEPGDFSSTCYPFEGSDDDEPYIGNELDYFRLAVSLKPVFLLLAEPEPDSIRTLIREYPHAGRLLERLEDGDSSLRTTLRTALEEFCSFLRDWALSACDDEKVRVTSVGISLPAHWPVIVENYVAELFLTNLFHEADCFNISRDRIFFNSESQAIAHYLFKRRLPVLRMRDLDEETFIVADFGGQNLVSSVP